MLNFEEYQASVSQHPGNIYGSLVLYKVSPSCAEFRRISSFCKYFTDAGFTEIFFEIQHMKEKLYIKTP